ncbi:DUF5677 domain-containing protein [Mesorhizobium sp. LSJC255A00]|uniref:DUF5677 domain-containing protein n=1 Tax=Mesorhizobium sp. LSJC255A00 TaxID=1287313 RepID=UPI0018DCADF3|nr:DUF5677 domain-containing protein [Mesorhizobium sp. LSJC255A00]
MNDDLDAIVEGGNLGPEPSARYMERLDLLDNVVRECIFVSRGYGGIAAPSTKHFFASVLFTALLTRGTSLLCLAPLSPWADKKIEHWDYASLAGMVRSMIELRIAFHYLCVEQCSDEEWDCRWNLFNLHDCVSRIRMFESLGNDPEQLGRFEIQANELRERLKSNSFFRDLDPKRHKKLLHGQTAYLYPLEEMADRAGLPTSTFRWLYVLLSAHVHGLPMSYYRMGDEGDGRGRGVPSPVEENYSGLCLSLASTLIVKSRDELHQLFEGLAKPDEETPEQGPSVEPSPEGLTIGETSEVNATDDIRFVITRTGPDTAKIDYYYRPSNELVLERSKADTEGAAIIWLDPVFWTVVINGQPATLQSLEGASAARHAFRVDHIARTISFKTETGGQGLPSIAAVSRLSR